MGTINGTVNDDLVLGTTNVDSLFGDLGNDTLRGQASADTLNGGSGSDWASYSTSGSSVTVNLTTNLASGGAGNDILISIENIVGSSSADVLTGNTGDNHLDAGAGNDILVGGLGDDSLHGEGGDDTASYAAAAGAVTVNLSTFSATGADGNDNLIDIDIVIGSGFNDVLTGDSTNNTLQGGAGDDTIVASSGIDSLDGGTGTNTLSFANIQSGVTTDLGDSTATVNGSAQTVVNFTNVIGSGFNDILIGNGSANNINGGTGNDTIDGDLGADVLTGGDGFDFAGYQTATSAVNANLFTGLATGGAGADTLSGFEGLIGSTFNDRLYGGTSGDYLDGSAGRDSIYGGGGNDTLVGGADADSLEGGAGNDYYIISTNDVIREYSTSGNDTVEVDVTYTMTVEVENLIQGGVGDINATGNALNNTMTGNAGNNRLTGNGGLDSLFGGIGNDTLDGGANADSLTGGAGNDLFIVDQGTDTVVELADEGHDTVSALRTYTLSDNVEDLILNTAASANGTGNSLNNVLTGGGGNNKLYGLVGDDTLYGGNGVDRLEGGTGNDLMEGGLSNDIYVVDAAGDVVVELLDAGTDTVETSVNYVLTANVEKLILKTGALDGTGNDLKNTITGNGGQNHLYGGSNNDTLFGNNGHDTIDGGTGNDSMLGGIGNDVYVVDSVTDKVTEELDEGTDTVQVGLTNYVMTSNVENLVQTGTGDFKSTGNELANTMTGNDGNNELLGLAGNDVLNGGIGNDTLNGGTGNDSMSGGVGNDTYIIDSENDVITEAALEGTDTVSTIAAHTLADNFENLTLTGTAAVAGTGNSADNVITGNSGANALSGLDGADTLNGGSGADTLTGGTGADQFIFTAIQSGSDTIADFNAFDGGAAEGDLLVFQNMLIGTFDYLEGGAFTGGGDNSEARFANGAVQMDVNGDGSVDFTFKITGMTDATELTEADFLFI